MRSCLGRPAGAGVLLALILGLLPPGAPAEELSILFKAFGVQELREPVAFPFDVPLAELGGKPFDSATLRGKPALITFWATWCGACRSELPVLRELAAQNAGGTAVLAVTSEEDGPSLRTFVESLGPPLEILLDRDGRLQRLFGVSGIPHTLLLDGAGFVRGMVTGGRDWLSATAGELLEALAKERGGEDSKPDYIKVSLEVPLVNRSVVLDRPFVFPIELVVLGDHARVSAEKPRYRFDPGLELLDHEQLDYVFKRDGVIGRKVVHHLTLVPRVLGPLNLRELACDYRIDQGELLTSTHPDLVVEVGRSPVIWLGVGLLGILLVWVLGRRWRKRGRAAVETPGTRTVPERQYEQPSIPPLAYRSEGWEHDEAAWWSGLRLRVARTVAVLAELEHGPRNLEELEAGLATATHPLLPRRDLKDFYATVENILYAGVRPGEETRKRWYAWVSSFESSAGGKPPVGLLSQGTESN